MNLNPQIDAFKRKKGIVPNCEDEEYAEYPLLKRMYAPSPANIHT